MGKNKIHKELLSKNNFAVEQDNYIRALESSVQLLQNEIELLRSKKSFNNVELDNEKKDVVSNKIRSEFLKSKNESELVEKLHSILSDEIPITESNLYIFTPDKLIQPYYKSNTAITLYNKIKNLEEQGIIDWAIEKKELSFILDLDQTSSKFSQFIIIYPIYTRGQIFSIFFALTNISYEDLEQSKINFLKSIIEDAAIALDNIKSLKEISLMNQKLNHLNSKIIESSLFSSIGEFTSSIVSDMESPLNIINVNLDLFESGIGDKKQRIKIIREQLNVIGKFKEKLNDLTNKLEKETNHTIVDLSEIIDDVLFLTYSQFQRNGISIIKEFDANNFNILGYKSQIEQTFFNLLLNARNYLPDGGEIRINLYRDTNDKISITIADNGLGIDNESKIRLFEPFDKQQNSNNDLNISLYYSKQIIKKHKGKISIYSELGKGTTIKITFPSINK